MGRACVESEPKALSAGTAGADVFFQRDVLLADRCGGLDADVAVVPWLVADAGDVRLVGRVALNEAIFVGVRAQPGVLLGALKAVIRLGGD